MQNCIIFVVQTQQFKIRHNQVKISISYKHIIKFSHVIFCSIHRTMLTDSLINHHVINVPVSITQSKNYKTLTVTFRELHIGNTISYANLLYLFSCSSYVIYLYGHNISVRLDMHCKYLYGNSCTRFKATNPDTSIKNIRFVFFCMYRSLQAVLQVAKRITSKFWAPEIRNRQYTEFFYDSSLYCYHLTATFRNVKAHYEQRLLQRSKQQTLPFVYMICTTMITVIS